MKRILLWLLAALLCLSLAGCGAKGDTSSVRIVRGASETLEKDEIRAAMDAAMEKSQFLFQSQRKAMPKNAQTAAQLHSSHTLVK